MKHSIVGSDLLLEYNSRVTFITGLAKRGSVDGWKGLVAMTSVAGQC